MHIVLQLRSELRRPPSDRRRLDVSEILRGGRFFNVRRRRFSLGFERTPVAWQRLRTISFKIGLEC